MADVFISYSRRDIAFARLLHEALREQRLETWIDWQDIPPSVDWLAEVYQAIEQADTVVFLISRHSLASEICGLEMAHAVKNNKRLIPVVLQDVDPHDVPPYLAALNWIFFRTESEFPAAFQALQKAIHTDYEWVKAHTRLQLRALEWERNHHERSYLLRGQDLERAESWLAQAADKEPRPTALQTQYLLAGRREAVRRQRLTLAAVLAALAVAVTLGALAWVQRDIARRAESRALNEAQVRATAEAVAINEAQVRATAEAVALAERDEAQRQARLALSGQLVANAQRLLAEQPDLALLLNVEALEIFDTPQARGSLLTALTHSPRLRCFLHGPADTVFSVAFSPDGRTLATGGCSQRDPKGVSCLRGEIRLWNVADGRPVGQPLQGHASYVVGLSFSPLDDGRTLVSVARDGSIALWDVPSGEILGLYAANHEVSWQVMGVAFSPDGTLLATGGCAKRVTSEAQLFCGRGEIGLWNIVQRQPQGEPMEGHGGWVKRLTFSPDGRTLATAAPPEERVLGQVDEVVILWDVTTGQPLGRPLWHRYPIDGLAFGPGGRLLASAICDSTDPTYSCARSEIRLWDVASGELAGSPLLGHRGRIWSLVFRPDGQVLASGGDDRTIVLWDVARGQPVEGALSGHAGTVISLAFSPDGQLLASGSQDHTAALWDMVDDEPLGRLLGESTGIVYSLGDHLAFDPDSRTLAVEAGDGILLWDIDGWQPRGEPLADSGERMRQLAFSGDGTLYAAYGDGTALRWDLDGDPGGTPLLPTPVVLPRAVLSPDASILAVGQIDGQVQLWDTLGGRPSGEPLAGLVNALPGLAFSPDGTVLAAGGCGRTEQGTCVQGVILRWDVASRQPLGRPLTGHAGLVRQLALGPGGNLLASFGSDQILLWDTAREEVVAQIPESEVCTGSVNWLQHLAFSPDGGTLALLCFEGAVTLWDVSANSPRAQLFVGGRNSLHSLALSPDGRFLAVGDAGHRVLLWDLEASSPFSRTLSGHADSVSSLAFGAEGQILASGSTDGTILLWDVVTGALRGEPLCGHADEVIGLAFAGAGTLVSLSRDHTLNRWNVADGVLLDQPLDGYADRVAHVAFSPDGQVMATISCRLNQERVCAQAEVRLWDISTAGGAGPGSSRLISPPIRFPVAKYVGLLALSSDGRTLATGGCVTLDRVQPSGMCIGSALRLWDVATGEALGRPFAGPASEVRSLALSPDGARLAAGGDTVVVWQLDPEQPISQTVAAAANCLAFSPDGQTLALGALERVSLWDVTSGQAVGPALGGGLKVVYGLAFSADGRLLAAVDNNNQVILWDIDPASWQSLACRRANRNLTAEEWTVYMGSVPYRPTCPGLP